MNLNCCSNFNGRPLIQDGRLVESNWDDYCNAIFERNIIEYGASFDQFILMACEEFDAAIDLLPFAVHPQAIKIAKNWGYESSDIRLLRIDELKGRGLYPIEERTAIDQVEWVV
ncbi:hypothetical protein NHB13_10190 [Delftia tsuruhatensis]|uniref:hypothetical protein n=1 Tax=Delftia tsuruhatensis TaxID=180282 RepID=UPI0020919844|nr:hypothetical protein [Delftia tsuruhatensis]MCO5336972.1 hypothetical protein [Delftia tsuruhatensis]